MSNPLRVRYALAMMFGLAVIALPQSSVAQIAVSITIAPPPLPVYEQPPIPDDGYIWAPGYWSYGQEGYYWVPGTWVQPPEVGFLWTPGYWGWSEGVFAFSVGYWGPHIGFYGGVNYGFGYVGHGYEGGEWRDDHFFYNRSVNNVSNVTNIHNVYNKTVINNVTVNNVSYNGGNGGVSARATADEERAAHETHRQPTPAQVQHHTAAASNRALLASVNQGKPEIAATPKPGQFSGPGVVKAARTGAPGGTPISQASTGRPTAPRPATMTNTARSDSTAERARSATSARTERPPAPVHPNDLPKFVARAPISTGDTTRDAEIAKQHAGLQARHTQEREALQQKQTQEHEQLAQQKADAAKTAAIEQQHQQQTQQLQQRHVTEQGQLTHTPPPPPPPRPPARSPNEAPHRPTN